MRNFPKKKYKVIYADPPWPYKNFNHKKARRGAAKEYPLMSMSDLASLPVADIAAENSALFMWTTGPMNEEAMKLMRWWGFEYKTWAFLWIKWNKHPKRIELGPVIVEMETPFMGNGWTTRSNAEIVLLGVRGNPKRVNASVHQLVFAPVAHHSAKPPEVRNRIVELMGKVPRIELFARGRPAPNWDAWGNEVTR